MAVGVVGSVCEQGVLVGGFTPLAWVSGGGPRLVFKESETALEIATSHEKPRYNRPKTAHTPSPGKEIANLSLFAILHVFLKNSYSAESVVSNA